MPMRPDRTYRLLIADDDSGFRQTLRSIFERCFQLFEADSGEEAVEIIHRTPIDIALFDMHMRLLTGIEVLRVLKEINALAPGILITGDSSDEVRRKATDAQAFDVLSKPITKSRLVETVSTALADAYHDEDIGRILQNRKSL